MAPIAQNVILNEQQDQITKRYTDHGLLYENLARTTATIVVPPEATDSIALVEQFEELLSMKTDLSLPLSVTLYVIVS